MPPKIFPKYTSKKKKHKLTSQRKRRSYNLGQITINYNRKTAREVKPVKPVDHQPAKRTKTSWEQFQERNRYNLPDYFIPIPLTPIDTALKKL